MAPRRKSCSRRSRRQHAVRECQDHLPHRKRKNPIHRVQRHKSLNVAEAVYGFLGNVAVMNAERKKKINVSHSRTKVRKPKSRRSRVKPCRVASGLSRKSTRTLRNASESNLKSDASPEGPVEALDAPQTPRTSTIDTTSTVSTELCGVIKSATNATALMKKRSLIQIINNYIKAGIEEGKRRAKRYMCKALSFGVDSGYLIPTDPEGQVLRVSSVLANFGSHRINDEERGKRRKLRRGDAGCDSLDRRTLRRRSSPSERRSRRKVPAATKRHARSRSPSDPGSCPSNSNMPSTTPLPSTTEVKRTKRSKQTKKQKGEKKSKKTRKRKVKRRRTPSTSRAKEVDQNEPAQDNFNNDEESPKLPSATVLNDEEVETVKEEIISDAEGSSEDEKNEDDEKRE